LPEQTKEQIMQSKTAEIFAVYFLPPFLKRSEAQVNSVNEALSSNQQRK